MHAGPAGGSHQCECASDREYNTRDESMIKWKFLRLSPYDTDTEEGRASERQRRAALTTLLSAFARGSQLAGMFVSMRVALPYLGQARFGVWMTISSLTSLLKIFDFGIGNGLVFC